MTSPRIVIVGCGAVGLFYGAKLALSGQDVHFLMRQDFDKVSDQNWLMAKKYDQNIVF